MIDPKELRKGSFVYYNPHGRNIIKQVKELREIHLICNSLMDKEQRLNLYYDGNDLQPVPLTLEILEQCGFIKSISDDTEERDLYSIQVSNNTSLYFDNGEWYLSHFDNNNHFQNDFWSKPKYLHQLQNLFYYLTGEELIVNAKEKV